MKNISNKIGTFLIIGALSIAPLFFTNCKKDTKDPEPAPAPPPPPTNTEKLTGKNFKMVAYTVDPAVFGITDWYAQMQDCQKDDIIRFETNGVYKEDEGGTKCNSTDPQTTTGTWTWNTTETVLSTTAGTVVSSYNVVTNDGTTLKVTATFNDGGVNYTETVTFTKQ